MSDTNRVVISVMGPHALEGEDAIFSRKRADIAWVGETLWLCQSPEANPDRVQSFCAGSPCSVFFVAPATAGGARPTTSSHRMTEFSVDKLDWKAIPPGIGPVTGQAKGTAYAFVLGSLELCEDDVLDLWEYVDDRDGEPIRFRMGSSVRLARRGDSHSHPNKMLSRMRRILAIGTLAVPFCVWVR